MISGDNWVVHFGSCLDVLPTLPDNSVDSVVTDPPYELGFMGKKWDSSGIAFNSDVWAECLRVLKPGGHLLAFGGSRTWHRIAVAIEDAGFEVRDSIAWLYGSGFPKSLDISKAIDKAAGAEREVVGTYTVGGTAAKGKHKGRAASDADEGSAAGISKELDITAPATDDAKKWQGWGTALKPAFEPVVVGRKPIVGTVAANVLEYGTGGLNIDGSRIEGGERAHWISKSELSNNVFGNGLNGSKSNGTFTQGRWPANVILDEYTAPLVDEQSGISKSTGGRIGKKDKSNVDFGLSGKYEKGDPGFGDVGGASRFFYVAKASKRDRNEGLDQLPEVRAGAMNATIQNSMPTGVGNDRTTSRQNFHPTVKPTTLMRYLVKLVTPPGGIVLDPFTGSGSTGKAAILEGFQFIGVELTEDYLPIIEGRLNHAVEQINEVLF